MERIYNVPLRREFLKVPKYKRAKKAVVALRSFLVKHMKSENIVISKDVNEYIWDNGIENPPHHVKVLAKKEGEKVFVDLADKKESKAKLEKEKKLEKKREKTKKRKEALEENKENLEEKVEEETEDKKEIETKEKTEEKQTETKEVKEETKKENKDKKESKE